jgi:hypothetical protein
MHKWFGAADACMSGLLSGLLSAMACFSSRGPLQRTEQTHAYTIYINIFCLILIRATERSASGEGRERTRSRSAEELSSSQAAVLLQRERAERTSYLEI